MKKRSIYAIVFLLLAIGCGPAVISGTAIGGDKDTREDVFGCYDRKKHRPTITSVSPTSGTTSGGTTVTIKGSNFGNGSITVTFDGITATGTVVKSGEELTCITPAHAEGVVDVAVSNKDGWANPPASFTYEDVPPIFTGLGSTIPTSYTSIELRWKEATDNYSPPSKIVYLIYVATTPGGQNFSKPLTSEPGETSYNVPLLLPSTIYYFVVRARDEAGSVEQNVVEKSTTTMAFYAGVSESTTNMNVGRDSHYSILLLDGTVLIAGGEAGGPVTAAAEVFDPGKGTFTNVGSMNDPSKEGTITMLKNGTVLRTGYGAANSAETYDPSTRTFTRTSNSMSANRSSHTATLLLNGKVLLVGSSSGGGDASCDLYNPTSRTFSLTASLSFARYDHTATLLPSGKVLIAGGVGAGSPNALLSAEIYDPTTETFSPAGDLNVARRRHTATLLSDGTVFLAGGSANNSDNSIINQAEIYDPATNQFTRLSNLMTTARFQHTAHLLPNGTVILIAGRNPAYLNTWEIYHPVSKTFTSSLPTTLKATRNLHSSTLLPDGRILITGGATSTNTAELFDPARGIFLPTGNLATGRAAHSATLLPSGRVLLASGQDSETTTTPSAEIYDPAAFSFYFPAGSLNDARSLFPATLLADGRVLISGGQSIPASAGITSAEIYNPTSETFSVTGSLQNGLHYHKQTLLSNGRVLITGRDLAQISLSFELFNPLTELFSNQITSYDAFAHTVTYLENGLVLLPGGQNSGGYINPAKLYNPGTDNLSNTGSLNVRRWVHTATLLPGGQVLIAGGQAAGDPGAVLDGSGISKNAEIYDLTSGNFTNTAALMVDYRLRHTSTLLPGGRVILVGGDSASGALNSAEFYDSARRAFTTLGAIGGARTYHTATVLLSGRILLAGGASSNNGSGWPQTILNSCVLFDPGLGIGSGWKPVISSVGGLSNFPAPLSFGSTITVTGKRFTGISENGGGNGFANSSTNYPIAILMGLSSGNFGAMDCTVSRYFRLSATNWSSTQFDVKLPDSINNPPGYYMLVVIVNAVPSAGRIVKLQ